MNDKRRIVFETLDRMQIPYEVQEHPAAFTMEELERLGLLQKGEIPKNLFLRDASGKRHFLVTVAHARAVDTKWLRTQIGCSRLSFGSEERLERCLKLTPGSVGPFGVLNDSQLAVEVFFDRSLMNLPRIGVHPNDNTATVWIDPRGLARIVTEDGHSLKFLNWEEA